MESVLRLFVGYAVIAQSIAAIHHTRPASGADPAALRECLVAAQADHDELVAGATTDANL